MPRAYREKKVLSIFCLHKWWQYVQKGIALIVTVDD